LTGKSRVHIHKPAMDVFRQFRIRLLGLPLALLTLAGCAAGYREPSVPRSEMASINATAPVWIVTIDGKKVSRAGITGHKQFHISAGQHLIEVQYSQVSMPAEKSDGDVIYTTRHHIFSEQNIPVQFFATGGTTYYVRAERSGDLWKPAIADTPEPTRH